MKFSNIMISIIGISVMFGCSNDAKVEREEVGYLVTLSKNDIYYKCGDKNELVNKNGKFSCSSFPIGFYRDSMKIGSVSSLHGDKYVFPQDMQLKEDSVNSPAVKIASR